MNIDHDIFIHGILNDDVGLVVVFLLIIFDSGGGLHSGKWGVGVDGRGGAGLREAQPGEVEGGREGVENETGEREGIYEMGKRPDKKVTRDRLFCAYRV